MGNDYKKWLKDVLNRVDEAGWVFKHGSGHIVVYPEDKSYPPITLASTSNAPRTMANQAAELRRAGLDI